MTDAQETAKARFEEFDLADRMRRTLRVTGIGVQEMADYLEVSRESVGTWINGRITPRKTTLMAWALKTGARYEWLANGETPPADGPGGAGVHPPGLEPGTHWFRAGEVIEGPWVSAA